MMAGGQQQTVERGGTAGLLGAQRRIEVQQRPNGERVGAARRILGQVVREIGTDHDQGLVAAPHALQDLGHRGAFGQAHEQGHEPEARQHRLQEGKLHLETVFAGVGEVRDPHRVELVEVTQRGLIHRHRAQRRQERFGARHREAPHRDPMRRPEQHHAADVCGPGREAGVGRRRRGARVNVARVGHEQRLGPCRQLARRDTQQIAQLHAQAQRLGGVKGPGHGGGSDGLGVGRCTHLHTS
jgi:hypothetical protein